MNEFQTILLTAVLLLIQGTAESIAQAAITTAATKTVEVAVGSAAVNTGMITGKCYAN